MEEETPGAEPPSADSPKFRGVGEKASLACEALSGVPPLRGGSLATIQHFLRHQRQKWAQSRPPHLPSMHFVNGVPDTCCSCWLLLGSEHGLVGKSISAACCLEHVQPIAVRWDQQYDSSESCAQGMCVPRSHTPAWCCIPKMIKCASRVPAV